MCQAGEIAAAGKLVLFGIAANEPHTGYGYIRRGTPLDGFAGAFTVAAFTEKPDRETAAEYLAAVLSDGDGDPDAVRELLRGMPPATAAVFGLDGKWDQLAPGCARLLHVLRPAAG